MDEAYVSMLNEIPEEIIAISAQIVDQARRHIDNPISSNIVFTLADHIHFSIQRCQKQMNVQLPIVYDIQHLFEKEMSIGAYGLRLIQKELHITLPKEEAAYIALHIINAEMQDKNKKTDKDNEIIEHILTIIEREYDMQINKDNFNYSRFVSHMHYLLKRGESKQLINTDNKAIYDKLKQDYRQSYECVRQVSAYLNGIFHMELSDEEKLYLMLHINRLCTREDCNR